EGKLYREAAQLKEIKDWSDMTTLGDLHRQLKVFSAEIILFYTSVHTPESQEIISNYLVKRTELPTYLSGEDLKEHGLTPGPSFAQILLDLEVALLNEQ